MAALGALLLAPPAPCRATRRRPSCSSAAASGSRTTATWSRSGPARLSGKVSNAVTVGFLNMQTEEVDGLAPANNFTVARMRRDLPNRSSIGGLFVNRQATGRLAADWDFCGR